MCLHFLIKNALFLMMLLVALDAKAFTICAEPDNLPMSQQSTEAGYEIEVARLLAKSMNQKLTVKWVAQRDHAYYRQTLEKGACDAIMGVPSDFKRLTTTSPWYSTGFVFISMDAPVKTFDEPRLKKARIGVPATGLGPTPPVVALVNRSLEKNLHHFSVYEQNRMVTALKEKQIDVAVLWGPTGGWFSKDQKSIKVSLTPERDGNLSLVFDFSIGLKKGNKELKKKLNNAIAKNKKRIESILLKWHVPMRNN
jgi:mxaJ protein